MAEIKHIDSETAVMTLERLYVTGELMVLDWLGEKGSYPMKDMQIDLELGRELLKDRERFAKYLSENVKEGFGAQAILGGYALIEGGYKISDDIDTLTTTKIIFTHIEFGKLNDEDKEWVRESFYGRD